MSSRPSFKTPTVACTTIYQLPWLHSSKDGRLRPGRWFGASRCLPKPSNAPGKEHPLARNGFGLARTLRRSANSNESMPFSATGPGTTRWHDTVRTSVRSWVTVQLGVLSCCGFGWIKPTLCKGQHIGIPPFIINQPGFDGKQPVFFWWLN